MVALLLELGCTGERRAEGEAEAIEDEDCELEFVEEDDGELVGEVVGEVVML